MSKRQDSRPSNPFEITPQMQRDHEAKRAQYMREQENRQILERALANADEVSIVDNFRDMPLTMAQLREILVEYSSSEYLKSLLSVYASREPSQQEMDAEESASFERQR